MGYTHRFIRAGSLLGILALLLAVVPVTSVLAAPSVAKTICEDGLIYNPDKKKCDCVKTKHRDMGLRFGSRFAVCDVKEKLISEAQAKALKCDSKDTFISINFNSTGAIVADVLPLKSGDFIVGSVINDYLIRLVRFDKDGVQKSSFDVIPSAGNAVKASTWNEKYITLTELNNGSIVVGWGIFLSPPPPSPRLVDAVYTIVDAGGNVIVPQKTLYPRSSPPVSYSIYIDTISLDNGGFIMLALTDRKELSAFIYDQEGTLQKTTLISNTIFDGNNVSAIKIPGTNNIAVGWSGATSYIINASQPFNLAVITQEGDLVSGPAYNIINYNVSTNDNSVTSGFGFLPLSNGKIAVASRNTNDYSYREMFVQNFNQDLTPDGAAVAVRQLSAFTGANFIGLGMAPLDEGAGYLAATWDFSGDSFGISKEDDVFIGAYSNDNVLQGNKEVYFGKGERVLESDGGMRNRLVKMADGKIALFLKDKFKFYDGDAPYCAEVTP